VFERLLELGHIEIMKPERQIVLISTLARHNPSKDQPTSSYTLKARMASIQHTSSTYWCTRLYPKISYWAETSLDLTQRRSKRTNTFI
jgi:hypothetical protein